MGKGGYWWGLLEGGLLPLIELLGGVGLHNVIGIRFGERCIRHSVLQRPFHVGTLRCEDGCLFVIWIYSFTYSISFTDCTSYFIPHFIVWISFLW